MVADKATVCTPGVVEVECPQGRLSFAKTPSAGQVVDLSALIRREWPSHDPHAAAPAPPLPVPLRRPPPARSREPCPAPAARRVQKEGDPTETATERSTLLGVIA